MHARKILVFALATLLLPLVAAAEPMTWNVDSVHSAVTFKVRHIFTKVHGSFNEFEGTIVYDAEKPEASSVEFTVQATSIDTKNDNRDGHLRSADFFDVENHKTLSFKSSSVKPAGEGELHVTGKMTIRGTTKTITIPVAFLGSMATPMGTRAGFSTEYSIDRTEYGVKFNRAMEGGGMMLSDDVEIEISIEATLAGEGEG